jgi:hypothetical protein
VRDDGRAEAEHLRLRHEPLDRDVRWNVAERRRIHVAADGEERSHARGRQPLDERRERLGAVEDRPHGRVDERARQPLEQRRWIDRLAVREAQPDARTQRLLVREQRRDDVHVQPLERARVWGRLQPCRAPERRDGRGGALEDRERHHRPESVVDGRKPE